MSGDDLNAPADGRWLADTRFDHLAVPSCEVELALLNGFELVNDIPSPYPDRVILRAPAQRNANADS